MTQGKQNIWLQVFFETCAFSAYFETEIKVTILLILYWSQYSSFYIFLHAGRHIFDTLTWLTSLPGKLGLHIASRVAVLNSFAPFKDTLHFPLQRKQTLNRRSVRSLLQRPRDSPTWLHWDTSSRSGPVPHKQAWCLCSGGGD